MVNRLRLNEKSVREAEPTKGRDYQIFDTEVRGFAVCVYRSGSRAFTIDYRHAGRQRRMTIGRWPEWSATAARERAKDLRREIDAGGDPLGQKETGRDAPRFKDLIDRYTEVHLPHLSALNASDQKSMLAKMVAPDWGNKLVAEITPYDVEKLLNKVAAGRARPSKAKPNNRARKLQGAKATPVRANRTGEVLRKMFTYAVSWGWRGDNPASSFRRRIENPRERFLNHDEIHKLAEALDRAEDRRAADIIRLCMLTGARVGDPDAAREVKKYLANNKVSAVMSLVTSDPRVRAEINDFDKNSSLLNLKNGTLDLSCGELRPHAANDMFTKIANVEFAPEAGCPTFMKVLGQSLPIEHADFLLRYLGYALLGDPKEQVFAILHGAGANGKSTVINAISYLMGDYAANVEPATLIKQKSERIRTDIARLHGVYLAVTSELATGEILDAALVKRLTGGDTITARALYSSEFEYKPKFTLIMTTNALPVIDGADDALTRRIILIPFSNVVLEHERDPTLNRQLEFEASGIFNLLLTGLRDYRDKGLAVPDDIKEERARFAASSDMLAAFLSDETEVVDGQTTSASNLFIRYQMWCSSNGLRSLSNPQFKRELIKKGYESKRLSSGITWVGVRLRRPRQ